MKVLAKQNRDLIMINAQNSQNENDAEKIILQVPEQYEDFNKKIVFDTPDGIVWDIIENNEYLIKKAISKFTQVDFYIWLTKGEIDFRTKTKTLLFYNNTDASDEITDEEIGRVNTVINLLEEEIEKVEQLEIEINDKLQEINSAIESISEDISDIQTEQTTQNENIQENADNISSLNTRVGTNENSISNINTTIGTIQTEQTTQNNKISALETDNTTNKTNIATLQTDSGHSILLELNTTTYVLTATLKNKQGTTLNTSSIDLPVEQLVVSVSYDENTKELVITLKNGEITRVPLGGLVSGLQTEITSSNKLSSDLVDDTNHTHKFVSAGEKETWNAKYNKPSGGIPKTDLTTEVQTSLGKADTALQQQDLRNSVKPEDTTFIKRGNQLFNKSTITNGYYVSFGNGRLQPNSSYFTSDFIPISSEEINIIISNPLNALQLAFYNSNKTYISGSTTVPVTIPSNAEYVRFSYLLSRLDEIMVNYGNTLLPYEDFHLIIENLYVNENKVFHVGSNRDITSLKDGIEIATQYDNAILYVDEGIYNLVEEFGQSYLDGTTSDKGLILKNNIHVIFSPKSKVTFNYNGNNSHIHKNFSPFNSGIKGFTIENLTLECSNCRYGIHDERGNSTDRYKNIYKNCEISLDNSNNPDWSNPQNIGFGLGNDGEVEVESCVFNNWITFHLDNANRSTSQAIVTVKNSYFKIGAVWVDGNQSITALSRFIVSNNSFSQAMHIGELYNSVELFTFNNEIRN